jgi:hypothetical protein
VSVDPRFLRQVLLAEVGERGQARIGASTPGVAGEGLAHEVAARYALAAGARSVAPGPVDVDALAPVAVCSNAAARAVLAGSRAALAALLAAVREGESAR